MKQLEMAKREGARKGGSSSGFGITSPSASMEAVHVATEVIDTSASLASPSVASKVKTMRTGKGMSLKK